MKVMVCDGETRSALAALRALRARGVYVVVASHKQRAMSFASRDCAERLVYPSPTRDPEGFMCALRAYTDSSDEPVCIMAFTDPTMDLLMRARHDGTMPRAIMVIPRYEDYARATDKEELAALLGALGIPTPRVYTRADIEAGSVTYPLIVKPARTVAWGATAYKDTARVVFDRASCARVYDAFCAASGRPPLVQAMLTGSEYGLGVYAIGGDVHTLFAYRRLRSITAHGGVSALRESIPLTPEHRHIATTLVHALRWEGVMMIELKEDTATGALTVIEINARFWGSLYLAIASGADFPYLLYMRALGTIPEPLPPYRVGVRARHLLGDLMHLRALGRRAWSWEHLHAFCTWRGRDLFYDVLSLRDPLPGIVEFTTFIRSKL